MLLQGGNVPGERTELLLLFTNCIFLLVSRTRAFAQLSVAFSFSDIPSLRIMHAERSSPLLQ